MSTLRTKGRAAPSSIVMRLERRWCERLDGHILSLRWSPDGTYLAAAIADGPITIFDLHGTRRHELPGHSMGTTALDWQPSAGDEAGSPLLASAGQDGYVRLWNGATGTQVGALRHGTSWVERVAYHSSGRFLAAAAGKELRVWDATGTLCCAHRDHASTITDIAWKPGSEQIAAVAYGGTTLWTLHDAEPMRRYAWKGSSLVLSWSPDARLFATGDQDQTVHFWYADSGKDLHMWGYETKIRELAWDCSSRYLATGGGREVVVWDTSASKRGPEGSKPMMLALHEAYIGALAYQHQAPKDRPMLLASAGQDGLLALWCPNRSQKPLVHEAFDGALSQLAWSPDDQTLAVGGEDGTVALLAVS